MRSEDEDSNESWATQEEFTSELILRYRALTLRHLFILNIIPSLIVSETQLEDFCTWLIMSWCKYQPMASMKLNRTRVLCVFC